MIKVFIQNFKHYPSSIAILLSVATCWFAGHADIVPKPYADAAIMILTVFLGTFFVGPGPIGSSNAK